MRLFVDCDDTLVLYDSEGEVHPYGFVRDTPYHFNETLIAFIWGFRAKYPEALIVIWSGGGSDYALRVALEAGLGGLDIAALVKDRTTFYLVGKDDIVVDDQALGVAAVITPPDFFDDKDNWGLAGG